MTNSISYLSFDEVCDVYAKTVEHSGGGFHGILQEGGIRAVLDFIQQDAYYPDLKSKLTHLVYSFCRGHYFSDGNKRIAITLGTFFLLKNGYMAPAKIFMCTMEAYIYHVAAGSIPKELFADIIEKCIAGADLEEETKVALVNAIAQGEMQENQATSYS